MQLLCDDYNQDGNLDILCTGNFYAPEVETTRYDASIGMLLLGDGKNNFTPMHFEESGFFTPSDARGMAKIKLSKSKTNLAKAILQVNWLHIIYV